MTLDVPTNTQNLVIPYSVAGDFVYETGYTLLYTNLETVGCPVTECALMDSTCGSVPAPPSTNFW